MTSKWHRQRQEVEWNHHLFTSHFLDYLLNHHQNLKWKQKKNPKQTGFFAVLSANQACVNSLKCLWSQKQQKSSIFCDLALPSGDVQIQHFGALVPFSSSYFSICFANSLLCCGTGYCKEKKPPCLLRISIVRDFVCVERRKWRMEMLIEEAHISDDVLYVSPCFLFYFSAFFISPRMFY